MDLGLADAGDGDGEIDQGEGDGEDKARNQIKETGWGGVAGLGEEIDREGLGC